MSLFYVPLLKIITEDVCNPLFNWMFCDEEEGSMVGSFKRAKHLSKALNLAFYLVFFEFYGPMKCLLISNGSTTTKRKPTNEGGPPEKLRMWFATR